MDVGVSGFGSLMMMQRTLATLSHCIAARLVRRRPSSARSMRSFWTSAMALRRSATDDALVVVILGTSPQSICCPARAECECDFYD